MSLHCVIALGNDGDNRAATRLHLPYISDIISIVVPLGRNAHTASPVYLSVPPYFFPQGNPPPGER